MLRDPRSEALATNFAAQWLYLRDVHAKTPSPRLFPDFDLSLRDAFERETTLFLESVFREDRSVIDLLRSNDTFMNERLAKHYGVPNVLGNNFRRVTYPEDNPRRGLGLLGHSSILTLTSYANRTSPVLRGKYVLGNLLGAPPAPPPPNIPALATENKESGKVLPMREALAQHRANPACAGCHAAMDPIGFAMDNFDALGRWRTVDASGATIDPSGVLPDGTRFEGVAGLRQVLLSHPERFVSTLTENLLAYAVGRSLEYYDQPVVRTVVRDAAPRDYRFSELVLGIVNSPPSRQEGRGAADRDRGGTALRRRRIMIITKRALPRRTFLRGMGATVALPFLDAMVPALSARAAKPAVRLGFVYIPNGTIQPMWVPATTGKDFELSPILSPLTAGARSHHGVERAGAPAGGQPRRRQRRPCARHGRLADRCACMGPRPWRSRRRPAGDDRGSNRGECHRQGHAAAIARVEPGKRDADRLRFGGLLFLEHDFLEVADDPAADGAASADGVRAALRPGQHAGAAPGQDPADEQYSRLRTGRGRRVAEDARLGRSGEADRISRGRARNRAADPARRAGQRGGRDSRCRRVQTMFPSPSRTT